MAWNRIVACALLVAASVGVLGLRASAVTPVRHALIERHQTVELARAVRRQQADLEASLRRRIAAMERASETPFVSGPHAEDVRRPATVAAARRLLVIARARLRSLDPRTRRRLHVLHTRYANLQGWLDQAGILRVCPVPAYTLISDTFGAMVRLPHVPVHRHQGDDIGAPYGVPILSPFDGFASPSQDKLGGLTVRVFGADGYVYNAHLSRLGQLGWVRAGDVIGYVGATGDATGPHDHFEWHPDDGVAVDPHALLLAACVDSATAP
jgi:murein DD-endopeptidase MepM/ murein hydrolase activator NlpD